LSLSQKKVIVLGIILAIVGLFSPFYSIFSFSSYEITIRIYTLFVTIGGNYPRSFWVDVNVFWVIMGYLPFVAFRLGVPLQFVRYYKMKVSRFELMIAGLIGEIPPFIMIFGSQVIATYSFPLPFHLLICGIVVLLKPVNDNEDVFKEYESLYSYDDH